MAKVLQVIDVDHDGHKVRLDDGRIIVMPHGGEHPHIGQEVVEAEGEPVKPEMEPCAGCCEKDERILLLEYQLATLGADTKEEIERLVELAARQKAALDATDAVPATSPDSPEAELKAPTIEHLNSPSQEQAQNLSEAVNQTE